jgi:hypothetical protein
MGTKMSGPASVRGFVGPGASVEEMGAREPVGEGMSELMIGLGSKPLEGRLVLMVPLMEGSTEVVTDWRVVAVESYEVWGEVSNAVQKGVLVCDGPER